MGHQEPDPGAAHDPAAGAVDGGVPAEGEEGREGEAEQRRPPVHRTRRKNPLQPGRPSRAHRPPLHRQGQAPAAPVHRAARR